MTDQPAREPEPAASADDTAQTDRDRVTVRRSPRYGRFIILGAGLGAVVTFVLTNLFPTDEAVGFGALFGYFLLFGVPAGAAIGAVIAVLLERVVSNTSGQLEIARERVAEADAGGSDPVEPGTDAVVVDEGVDEGVAEGADVTEPSTDDETRGPAASAR